jgi:hypothetical protein
VKKARYSSDSSATPIDDLKGVLGMAQSLTRNKAPAADVLFAVVIPGREKH